VYPLLLRGNGTVNTFTRQQIHVTIEELLGVSFYMQSCRITGESVGLFVYPLIVAGQRLGKRFPTEGLLEAFFVCCPCRIKGKNANSCSQNLLFFVSIFPQFSCFCFFFLRLLFFSLFVPYPSLLLFSGLYILIAAMKANKLLTRTGTCYHGFNVSDVRFAYDSITLTTKFCTLIAVGHIISEYS
jgi:hypothetical protein